MVSKAICRYSRVSAYKARLIANLIKGKDVKTALAVLTFSPKKSAGLIKKILQSAVSNAEQSGEYESDNLIVRVAKVDSGPFVTRYDFRAMGRAVRVRHRTSHITIELDK